MANNINANYFNANNEYNYLRRYECYLCCMPKQYFEIMIKYGTYICKACSNYEGSRLHDTVQHVKVQKDLIRQQTIALNLEHIRRNVYENHRHANCTPINRHTNPDSDPRNIPSPVQRSRLVTNPAPTESQSNRETNRPTVIQQSNTVVQKIYNNIGTQTHWNVAIVELSDSDSEHELIIADQFSPEQN